MELQMKNKILLYSIVLIAFLIALSCSTDNKPVYNLITNSEPTESGVVVQSSLDGSNGREITVTATPKENWVFVRWGGDYSGTDNPMTVIMDDDKVITAIFEKEKYPITINTVGEGTVEEEVIQAKTTEHAHESIVKFTAVPDYGWQFVKWDGDITGNDPEVEIEIEGELEFTAIFERVDFSVTVHVEGEGEVTQEIVQAKTTENDYPFETQLQLTATPETGWEFVEWGGDASGNDNVIIIGVDKEKEITATFKRSDFLVTININGDGDVTQEIIQSKTISDEYPFETQVRLTAKPKSGWEFSNWSGFKNSKNRVIDIHVDENITLDASFKKIPVVETLPVSKITFDGAHTGGKVTSDSNVDILDKGICWSTSPDINPETNPDYQCRSENPGAGTFERLIGNLEPSTTYYVRAYAVYNIQSDTYALGNERSFTTDKAVELPTVSTTSITSITTNSAKSGGNITDDGNAPVTARGVCWSTSQNPTTSDNCTSDGTGKGNFTSTISNLNASTTYYVRAFAKNEKGTSYGKQINFTTDAEDDGGSDGDEAEPPTVSTTSISSIGVNNAFSGGTVSSDGGAEVTQRGICWNNSPNPTLQNNLKCTKQGSGTGSFNTELTELVALNNYWVRAYATNSQGTVYGNEVSFTTLRSGSGGSDSGDGGSDDGGSDSGGGGSDDGGSSSLPTVSTTSISSITTDSAISGGNVTSDGGATVTQRGICWNNSPEPTLQNNLHCTQQGSGTGSFSTTLSGLASVNNYWVRAYATNSQGTTYGNEVSFTTLRSDGGGSDDDGGSDSGGSDDGGSDPAPGQTEVLVMFSSYDQSYAFEKPVDIKLNNTWYRFHGRSAGDSYWNTSLGDGRGRVITLNETLTRVEFKPEQLQVSGLNAYNFGFWHYKIFNKDSDADLYNQHIGGSGINRWETHAGAGRLIGRCGYNTTIDPDPYFYTLNVPSSYNNTGKIMIIINGYGRNNPNFSGSGCS